MAYIEQDEYVKIYGDDVPDFDRLCWEMSRYLDRATTGVDGYRKLKYAFPTDEYDAEAVKRCLCELIRIQHQIESSADQMALAQSFIEREDGTIMSRKVTSVSSGSESISYATTAGDTSMITAAAKDKSVRDSLLRSKVEEYLSGVKDDNGVNLLYMGVYPRV